MHDDLMSRPPLGMGRAIGLGSILLGAAPAFAEGERWYEDDQVERGTVVFAQNCAECHGANAAATSSWREITPDGKYPPPPLNGTAHAWHHPMDALRRQINLGGVPLGGVMPAFGDKLPAEDIDAAIAYFQSKWNDEILAVWTKRNGDDDTFFRKVGNLADDRATASLRKRFPKLEVGKPAATPVKEIVIVKAGYELGIRLGVNGTPAIVMSDGRLQPGYLPADRLLSALGLRRKKQEP